MPEYPLTIGQLAKLLDIPRGTARGWVETFSNHLSESATPPKGETKLLNADDTAVLWTVYALRAAHKSIPDIDAALASGQRITPNEDAADERPPLNPGSDLVVQLSAAAASWEAAAAQLADDLDRARADLATERAARVAAEREAAAALAALEMATDKKSFIDRLLGR